MIKWETERLCVLHWFFGADFQARFYGLSVEKAKKGPAESFPTETRLKLNVLCHR